MKTKAVLQNSFFLLLFCCAALYLFNGDKGLRTYFLFKKEFKQEEERVAKLEQEIKQIKQDIKKWQTDPLEKERVARQDLGMSFTNELVYLTPAK